MIVAPIPRRFQLIGLICITLVVHSAVSSASPADGQSEDDSDWGNESEDTNFADFDDEESENETEQEFGSLDSADSADIGQNGALSWSMTGFARSDWGIWVNRFTRNAFAKGRQNLDLTARVRKKYASLVMSVHGEYDFAYLNDRDSYRESTLDTYEWLVDFREIYFALSFDFVDFIVGRQIVPWGEADLLSLVDVVNPRDTREPGLVQIDDFRLPVLSTRLGFFWGHHRIEGMMIHETSFGYKPPPYGTYSPFPVVMRAQAAELLAGETNPAESLAIFDDLIAVTDFQYLDDPHSAWISMDTQQYLGRWSYRGPGVDLGLYFASVVDNVGVIAWNPNTAMEVFGPYLTLGPDEEISDLKIDTIDIILEHRRYTMLGHSGAVPISNWLLKWELSTQINRPYNFQGKDEVLGIEVPGLLIIEATTVGFMLGLSYTGFRGARLFAEFSKRFFVKDYPEPTYQVDAPSLVLGYIHQLTDDLELEAVVSMLGWSSRHAFFEAGWIARLQLTYSIVDELKASLGYIYYEPETGLGMLSGLTNHDRLYLNLRWDFTIH